MEKREQVREWYLEAKECTKCEIRKSCKQVVPGAGNSSSEVVFIGEGPGQREDEQGVPFVGPAGKFLDKMLESINLDRKSVFISNVVRCRPPDNRDPSEKEIENCSVWTENLLSIIEPKIVVTLGKHSMKYFGIDEKISKVHGTIFLFDKYAVISLYHPAAALHNPNLKSTLLEDFKSVKHFIDGEWDGLNIVDRRSTDTAETDGEESESRTETEDKKEDPTRESSEDIDSRNTLF